MAENFKDLVKVELCDEDVSFVCFAMKDLGDGDAHMHAQGSASINERLNLLAAFVKDLYARMSFERFGDNIPEEVQSFLKSIVPPEIKKEAMNTILEAVCTGFGMTDEEIEKCKRGE